MAYNQSEQNARRLKHELNFFARHCLMIKTKADALKPFIFNNIQMKAHAALEELRARGKKRRIVFLKSRQVGLSTYTEARFFHKVFFHPGKNAFVLSEGSSSTENIFSMAKRFFNNLPKPLPKPGLLKDNSGMLEFNTDSNFRIATAGSRSVGRSMTINYLHGSEVAFWDNADSIIASLFPTIPDNTDSEIILESTANGVQGQGKFFYDKVQEGLDERSDWTTLFYPWYEHEEYAAEMPESYKLTEEEQELKYLYNLSDNQLAWRRAIIARDYKGREQLFKQEFPSCIQEAFIRSGTPLVPLEYIEKARKNVMTSNNIPVVVGVDPARAGGDRTVIVVRASRVILEIYAFDEMNQATLAGAITKIIQHYDAKRVFIDYAYGLGTYDLLLSRGIDIVELVEFGGKPTNQTRYANRRAEMYDKLRDWFLQLGGCYLGNTKYTEELVSDIMIHPDLEVQDSNGKLGLIKKKEITKQTGVKSPDFSDALALTFASFVPLEMEKTIDESMTWTPQKKQGFVRWADM